jgi:hypothetical protein
LQLGKGAFEELLYSNALGAVDVCRKRETLQVTTALELHGCHVNGVQLGKTL